MLVSSLALASVACSAAPSDPPPAALRDNEIAPAADDLRPIDASTLCVTSGRVESLGPHTLGVNAAGMRAVVRGDASRSAELAFSYRGASTSSAALASGEVRRQIGLKLRASDACNVVYVMWHAAPSPGVFVSVKRNAGKSTHAACGDGGYENLSPARGASAPAMTEGAPHTLRADLDGRRLRVVADGVRVWEGELPADALAFDGPAGVRSDNGEFAFELRVPSASAGGACPPTD